MLVRERKVILFPGEPRSEHPGSPFLTPAIRSDWGVKH